jgi:hypothetical protein
MINGHDKHVKGPMARFARFSKHCATATDCCRVCENFRQQ